MLWTSVVGALLDTVAPEVAGYYRDKQRQKAEFKLTKQKQEHAIKLQKLKGKEAWEIAKTQRAEKSEGRDHEWEMQSLVLHSNGWKDEIVLFIVSIPAVLCFIPANDLFLEEGGASLVTSGFAALETTPWYYQLLVVSIYFAIYGIRYYRRKVLKDFYENDDMRNPTAVEHRNGR